MSTWLTCPVCGRETTADVYGQAAMNMHRDVHDWAAAERAEAAERQQAATQRRQNLTCGAVAISAAAAVLVGLRCRPTRASRRVT